MEDYLIIGQAGRPHGVKGEIKVTPMTDDSSRFAKLKYVFLKTSEEDYERRKVLSVRYNQNEVLLTLEGVTDREQADRLKLQYLYIDREHAVKLPEGRYFIVDLEGCRVVSDAGEYLGTLTEVLQLAANDVYVIEDNGKRMLVPALKDLIVNVDIPGKVMTLRAQRLAEVAVRED